jgi:hypothetical protein
MTTPGNHKLLQLPAPKVRSLAWAGDDLIDWVAGAKIYRLNGEIVHARINYAYTFDAAVMSPSCMYAFVYARFGTKGLVLNQGKIVREINRSFYHAHVYEYPATILQLKDGREVLAHCPDDYRRLELEEVATGERLTASPQRKPADFFHSRLAVSPSGSYLVSAGWVWHPVDSVHVYSISDGLADPKHFDGRGLIDAWAEESSAAFLSDTLLAVSLEGIEPEDEEAERSPLQREIRVYDLATRALIQTCHPEVRVGAMMVVGSDRVLAMYDHPKLIELASGKVIDEWPQIRSGAQVSSISRESKSPPPMALDAARRRAAFACDDSIYVLQFD